MGKVDGLEKTQHVVSIPLSKQENKLDVSIHLDTIYDHFQISAEILCDFCKIEV